MSGEQYNNNTQSCFVDGINWALSEAVKSALKIRNLKIPITGLRLACQVLTIMYILYTYVGVCSLDYLLFLIQRRRSISDMNKILQTVHYLNVYLQNKVYILLLAQIYKTIII